MASNDNDRPFMQRVYDSEINVAIDWLWDDGFHVRLGDPLNGFKDETKTMTWREAEAWLRDRILERYPDSVFAMEERAHGRIGGG